MDLSQLEKVLLPYERKLRAQEERRRRLGVKEVERPTYERYITGTIERFDRRKSAFDILLPDNPFGEDIRERFKARTGYDFYAPLPISELKKPEDRVSQSLNVALRRLCREYHPQTLPVTPVESRVEINDKARMTRLIKKVALFLGAEAVRITRVDQRWVYQDVDISHQYAILVVVSHDHDLLSTAPSHLSALAVAEAYSRLKVIATQLADFICNLGYDAAYRETLGQRNPEMLVVPMAIDAGIGEFARNGRVLSPEFGINMRIKPVTTDLPLEVDKPISFGIHEFCMACENCATYCPSRAIPFGPPTDEPLDIYNNPGMRKWYINAERCVTFMGGHKQNWTTCTRCLSVCPWSHPPTPFHNVIRWLAVHSPMSVKKMLVRGDKLVYRQTRRIR